MQETLTRGAGDICMMTSGMIPHAAEQPSPCAATTEACASSAVLCNREAPAMRSLPIRTKRVSPAHHNQRKPTSSNEDPAQPKIK